MTKTWWWPLSGETCSLFDPQYTSNKTLVVLWLNTHLIVYHTQRGWHNLVLQGLPFSWTLVIIVWWMLQGLGALMAVSTVEVMWLSVRNTWDTMGLELWSLYQLLRFCGAQWETRRIWRILKRLVLRSLYQLLRLCGFQWETCGTRWVWSLYQLLRLCGFQRESVVYDKYWRRLGLWSPYQVLRLCSFQ